ncbi:heme exporter protein CcmD [Caulobacter sp. NIBR2454]|uniref:heme exporter protein CcmD n=1 Tax=Caulobacter sp. NIBR2454 TaxID=3015996 RepID=UPI0022B6C742|nr:heme exporter protein CcmD [Caulobacter sp. NIBR2454]
MLDLDAGKYAVYLWPAFGLTAAVFAWMTAATLLRARRFRRQVEALEKNRPEAKV